MFKNYLKIAFKYIKQNKTYSFINIAGLAVGIACCILIFLFVRHELSYDTYNKKADRIFRLAITGKIGDSDVEVAAVAAPTAEVLMQDYPEVLEATRFYKQDRHLDCFLRYQDMLFKESGIVFADANVFNVFTIPFIQGDSSTALTQPNSIVISHKMARKYFGMSNPIGKTLTMDNTEDYKVTGVFKDIPDNSHFHFDFFASLITLDDSRDLWWFNNLAFRTYVLLDITASPELLQSKFSEMARKYLGPMMERFYKCSYDEVLASGKQIDYYLQPVTSIHLHSNLEQEFEPNGDIKYVYIFSIIALFILAIACINFMNLSTARSMKRALEVGIRKVSGSQRTQLVMQFLSESILLATVAMILAAIFIIAVLPLFNQISDKAFHVNDLLSYDFVLSSIIFIFVIGILSGLYPALFLSSFKPITVLKQQVIKSSKGRLVRSLLVGFQFATSIILIICTLVVQRQLSYIQDKDVGFNQEQVLIIHEAHVLGNKIQSFKNQLVQYPEIVSATVSGFLPVTSDRIMDVCCPEGMYRENGTPMQRWFVDFDYIKTMGMEIIEGRNFSKEFLTDSSAIIVNEAAVKHFGWENPIGKYVGDYTAPPERKLIDWPVVGVVKDFHYESLRNRIGPLIFHIRSSNNLISLRLRTEDFAGTVRQIKIIWQEYTIDHPFEISFLNERFGKMYYSEQKIGRIFSVFAGLAIFIGCLGLFGLAAFTAEQKIKEIGIRKVLGSSITRIVILMTKDFLQWIILANCIAWPIAYFVMNKWLQGFAYRADIGLSTFLLSGLLAVLVAMLTVSYQAVKAALANPVDSLKQE